MSASQPEAPWPALNRASRTVVVVDVVESVRLMEQDEDDTIRRWQSFVGEVVTRLLPTHGGRLVKSLGDGLMLEFESVLPAIQCALAMQQAMHLRNEDLHHARRMCLRVGAHRASVVVDEHDIYGAGVNLAARVATLAPPGGVVVTAEVRDALVPALDADIEDLGLCYLKHVEQPVRAYRLQAARVSGMPDSMAAPVLDLLPTVAVLPFRCPGDLQEIHTVGELLADDATAALSRSSELHVISRFSSWAYAQRALPLEAAPRLLGVHFVLSGSLHGDGAHLKLYVELADALSGRVVWADRYTVPRSRLLADRDDVLKELVAGACGAMSTQALRRAATQPWPQLQAYELLLAAVTLMHRLAPADFQRARDLLEALMERLPRQAVLHAWMAKWYVLRVQQGWASQRAVDAQLALDHSRRAIDLDDECALAWAVDGFVQTNLFKNLDVAECRYARAVQVNPNDALAWSLKGTLHAFRGEGADAMEGAYRALKLSPLDPHRYFYLSLAATAALSAGRFGDAVELARSSLRLSATHTSTLRALTIAQVQLGEMEAARETMLSLRRLEPELTVRGYLDRSPSSGYPTGRVWAESLQQAGLPAG